MTNRYPERLWKNWALSCPEEAFSFYIDGSDIVFNLQIVEEVGCDFRFYEQQEKFPLTDEQIEKLKDAGYYSKEGFLIL